MTEKKLIHLEAIRGIASVIVLFHHFALGFLPALKRHYPHGLGGTPLYWIVNGKAAVYLFFVLSGFVLTRRFFVADRATSDLALTAAKRLPRLMLPAGIAIIMGYVLLRFSLDYSAEAAALTQSDWLKHFGYAGFPPSFSPAIGTALSQVVLVFFSEDEHYYNSNLWTMRTEYLGSLFCFLSVFVFYLTRRMPPPLSFAAPAILVASLVYMVDLFPFLLGMLLAWLSSKKHFQLGVPMSMGIVVAAILLCSTEDFLLVNAGAVLLLFAFIYGERISAPLTGDFGRWLGALSFPLYLVHLMVICSVSSLTYVQVASRGGPAALAVVLTAVVTLVFSLALAMPLMYLERWWVPWLNGQFRWLAARLRQPGTTVGQVRPPEPVSAEIPLDPAHAPVHKPAR